MSRTRSDYISGFAWVGTAFYDGGGVKGNGEMVSETIMNVGF